VKWGYYDSHCETGGDLDGCEASRTKLIVVLVRTRTGLPLKRKGSHVHCFTASTVADQSSFGPLMGSTLSTSPVFPMTT